MIEEIVARRAWAIITVLAVIALMLSIDHGFGRAQTSAPAPQTAASADQPAASAAQPAASSAQSATPPATASHDSIPPGTVITMQNWQQYQQFMPDGMAAFFQGKYFWKMPADVRL